MKSGIIISEDIWEKMIVIIGENVDHRNIVGT